MILSKVSAFVLLTVVLGDRGCHGTTKQLVALLGRYFRFVHKAHLLRVSDYINKNDGIKTLNMPAS